MLSAFVWETELGRRNWCGGNDITSGHVDFETSEIPSGDVQFALGSEAQRRCPSGRQTVGSPHRNATGSPHIGEIELGRGYTKGHQG